MTECAVCGAPMRPSQLVCAYCGAAGRVFENVEQELEALRELSAAAQKLGAKGDDVSTELLGRMGFGTSSRERISSFWRNAFVPRTVDGLEHAVLMAIGLLSTGAWQSTWHQPTKQANQAILDRLTALESALRIAASREPEAQRRCTTIRDEIALARTNLRSAHVKGALFYAALMLGMLSLLGCMGLLAVAIGGLSL